MHALAPSRWRSEIEAELARRPIAGLSFHFVPEREWPMRLGWTVGSGLRYVLWQWEASQAALRLDEHVSFDVVHHVSYGSLPGGSFLWRLGKPFVFGPAGGGQTTPSEFLGYFGEFRRSEMVRSIATRHLWFLDWPAIKTVRCSMVLCANEETRRLARRMGGKRVENMLTVCLGDDQVPPTFRRHEAGELVRLLWVGRFLARKGQQLTVEALNLVPSSVPVELVVAGSGPVENQFRDWLDATSLAHPVRLTGWLPLSEIHEAMRGPTYSS